MQQNKFHSLCNALNGALNAVDVAKQFFKKRLDENFDSFYDLTVTTAQKHNIGQLELPRYKRHPPRFDNGSDPHVFMSAKGYFHPIYFEACDLLCGELGAVW